MNEALITECGVVRGSVHKLDYGHKQTTAAPGVAGVSEAGDCSGDIDAGFVCVAGSAALRRECQSGFRWRRRYRDSATEPAELRLLPVTVTPDQPVGTTDASRLIEIVLAGGYRVRVGEGVQSSTLRLVLDVLERR